MATEKKITKAMILNAIKQNVEVMDFSGTEVSAADVVAYVDTTLSQMADKKVKANARAAEKRAAGDELLDIVASLLTAELQTRDDIFSQIEDESGELTVNKVGARLVTLVKNGVAVKEEVKIEGAKSPKMGYKLA